MSTCNRADLCMPSTSASASTSGDLANAPSGDVGESSSDDVADQETTEERETSEASSSTVSAVSLLECLRAPKKSELMRRRKIFTNPPRAREPGTRKKRPPCSSNPKSVTPAQRVMELPNECLTVSVRTWFCEECPQEVSLRSSIIKNHIGSSRHTKMKDGLKI